MITLAVSAKTAPILDAVIAQPHIGRGWVQDSYQFASQESWLKSVSQRQAPQMVRARQVIYRAGEPLDCVPMICEGWAARVVRLSDGRRQILSFLLPGDLLSAGAVHAGMLDFWVEAVTAVRCLRYDRTELIARLSMDRGILNAFLSACLAESTSAYRLATDLGRRSASERIARLILTLKQRLESRGLVSNNKFQLPLRQQHIADATGLTLVHVNRVIKAFRGAGLVELAAGTIRILDLPGLERLGDAVEHRNHL